MPDKTITAMNKNINFSIPVCMTLLICILFFCCNAVSNKKTNPEKKAATLPGKLVISNNDTCYIYDNADTVTHKFGIRNDSLIMYYSLQWMNTKDSFIAIEYYKSKTEYVTQSNLVCLDLSGNLVDRIYEAKFHELAGGGRLSQHDSLLYFTVTVKGDVKRDIFEGFNAEKRILIMDFTKKKIIREIKGFTVDLEDNNAPWIVGENRFIFSIHSSRKIMAGNRKVNKSSADKPGVYICDLETGRRELLIPDGNSAVASPIGKRICYIRDKRVYIRNLSDNEDKLLLSTAAQENVKEVHWTPDGKYIYLLYYKPITGDQEKLIEVSTGREISFQSIAHGYFPYTWK